MWQPIWPDTPGRQRAGRRRSPTACTCRPGWPATVRDAARRSTSAPTGSTSVDDPALWERARRHSRRRAVAGARRRCARTCSPSSASARGSAGRRSASAPARVVAAGTMLDPDALTHRLRAPLHRLQAARADLPRPRAAGAHPQRRRPAGADRLRRQGASGRRPGKHHLQRVFRRALDPMFGGRVAFVDDYDLHVAHFLVQGCDVWLNNPRKPLEASGTSGMKAAINGVPHLSIGDGWWAEGYNGSNGWLIDGQADPDDHAATDAADADALYALLEQRSRAGVLRSRSRRPRPAAALDRDRARGDALERAALLDAPHGQGIRDGDVRAGCAGATRFQIVQPSLNARLSEPRRTICCHAEGSRAWPDSPARSPGAHRGPSPSAWSSPPHRSDRPTPETAPSCRRQSPHAAFPSR